MKVLFYGDSITDAGRNRELLYGEESLGFGYVKYAAEGLRERGFAEEEIINRGISGNRIVDLYARVKIDAWNHKPDVLSILIGVNDVWHEISRENGVELDRWERIYRTMIEETLERLPDVKIMIIAPYVLHGPATADSEAIPNRWELFQKDVAEKVGACKRIADKYNLPLIELQPAFDKACESAEPGYWTADGVHPTAFGHELIKNLWLETFEKIK